MPQFSSPDTTSAAQSVALGALFVAIAAVTDSPYALTAATIGARLERESGFSRNRRYLTGGALVGLGLPTILIDRTTPRRD